MTETTPQPPHPLEALIPSLQQSADEHHTAIDGWLFNGSTALALLFTVVASILSAQTMLPGWKWLPSALSAFAGFLIAVERSLGFGSRWRFHTEMKSTYRTLIDMIRFYKVLPPDQQPKYLQDIWSSLYAARRLEGGIPGVGGAEK